MEQHLKPNIYLKLDVRQSARVYLICLVYYLLWEEDTNFKERHSSSVEKRTFSMFLSILVGSQYWIYDLIVSFISKNKVVSTWFPLYVLSRLWPQHLIHGKIWRIWQEIGMQGSHVYAAKNAGVTKNHEFSHHEKRGNGTSKVLENGDGKEKKWDEKLYPPWNQQQKHLKNHGWKMIKFPFKALWTPPSKVPPFSSCQSLSVPASWKSYFCRVFRFMWQKTSMACNQRPSELCPTNTSGETTTERNRHELLVVLECWRNKSWSGRKITPP